MSKVLIVSFGDATTTQELRESSVGRMQATMDEHKAQREQGRTIRWVGPPVFSTVDGVYRMTQEYEEG